MRGKGMTESMNVMAAKSLFHHEGHEVHEDLEQKALQAFLRHFTLKLILGCMS